MSSSPRAPPPRSGKRNQRGGRGGSANARGGAANAKANHQDASNKEATTVASTSPSASPQIDADPTEESSSSLTEMPTKPNRASKNAERRAARRTSNQSSTNNNNSPKVKSPSQNQDQTDKDSLSPSNSRDALTSSPNSNGFHSSPPSPQPSHRQEESPQPQTTTTIGAFGGWLSNRIMGGTPTSPEAEEGERQQEGTMTTTTKMQRSDSVSINSEAGESSAAYSASEVDGFEDAEDGDQVESVAGEAVEIDKEQEKQEAEKEGQVESVIASRKRQSTAKGDEDVAVDSENQVEESSSKKEESDEQPAISRGSTSISNRVERPQTPSSTEPSELVSEEILQSTPSTSQRESASGTSVNSSAPSASNSNSPSANSTSVDESVKNLDLVEPNLEASDALKTPMQPRTLLHQATPTKSRGGGEEEDLPTRLSEEGSTRGPSMLETNSNVPPSKPSSLASVDIKDRMSFEEDEGEGADRNSGQSFNVHESRQSHRNSDASSRRSISQAAGGEGMLSPTLSNTGPVSPGGSATSPGGTKRSFWGLLRSPSNSPATPASTIPSGRGGGGGAGIQRAFSLSSEGGGSGSENGGNGLLSPTTPTVGSTGRGSISSITTSNTPSITRTSRAPSFSPMSSFSSFAASISAARAAALGSNAASTSISSESKPNKVRLPRRQVDEMKIAEDAMRFIDARDILHSEKDATKIRELATRLEEGWREKLHEVTDLRSQVEDASDLQDDLQDENDALRTQLGSLSNTIVSREEEFEAFQKSVVEQQARERLLWDQEAKEERENVMHLVKEASTREIKEKAINSQLRLVLINALQGRVDGLRGLRKGMPGMPSSPLESRTEFENPDQSLEVDDQERQDRRASAARMLTAGSSDFKYGSPRRNSRRQTTENGGEDDDLLFAVSMSPTSESRPSTTLFNESLSFQTLRELGLIPQERDVQELEQDENGENAVDRNRRSIPISELPMSQLVAEKHAADNSLVLAIQEENKSLRTLAEMRANKNARLEEEVEQLRARLAQTEAAISEMFNDVSIANRE